MPWLRKCGFVPPMPTAASLLAAGFLATVAPVLSPGLPSSISPIPSAWAETQVASTRASSTLSANDLKTYQTAFRSLDAGRWPQALSRAATASENLPAKAIRWLYLQSSDSNAGFEEIVRFIRDNPSWPRLDRLKLRAEQQMSDALPDETILIWFRNNPPQTGAGFLLYARVLERAGMSDALQRQAVHAWRETDMTSGEEYEFRRKYRTLVPMADEVYRLDRLIWEGKYTAAERQARRVPDAYRRLGEARIRLARQSGGVDAAIAAVPPDLENDPGLVFERMRWRRRKGFDDSAIELLAWPEMQTSHPDRWWDERSILARDLLQSGDAKRAYAIAANHRVPDGAGFAEAEWFAGWVALRFLKDPEKAFPHFRDMYNGVGYPVSRSRAAYWAGRAAEAAGQQQIAMQWYTVAARHNTSFYGQVAAMKLPNASLLPPIQDPQITLAERQAFDRSEMTMLIRMLAEIGAEDTVRTFVRHLADTYTSPAHLALTAELSAAIGRLDLAVHTSRQAIKTDVVTLAGYPILPFRDSKLGDLSIVHGLIRQESGFDIGAVSHAGARGLMQLMPATARTVSGWEKIHYRKNDLTANMDYNVRLGSAYLKDLLVKFDGMLPMAFAGYNAGPNRVTQWVQRFGDPRKMDFEGVIDWMEQIPFSETRNYVQRVLENVTVYRQRELQKPVPVTLTADAG